MHENDDERRIRRLRHAALRQRLRLRKTPGRSSTYWQYGPFMLVDTDLDWMVVWSMKNADDVQAELASHALTGITSPPADGVRE